MTCLRFRYHLIDCNLHQIHGDRHGPRDGDPDRDHHRARSVAARIRRGFAESGIVEAVAKTAVTKWE